METGWVSAAESLLCSLRMVHVLFRTPSECQSCGRTPGSCSCLAQCIRSRSGFCAWDRCKQQQRQEEEGDHSGLHGEIQQIRDRTVLVSVVKLFKCGECGAAPLAAWAAEHHNLDSVLLLLRHFPRLATRVK